MSLPSKIIFKGTKEMAKQKPYNASHTKQSTQAITCYDHRCQKMYSCAAVFFNLVFKSKNTVYEVKLIRSATVDSYAESQISIILL